MRDACTTHHFEQQDLTGLTVGVRESQNTEQLGAIWGNFWPYFDLPTVVRKSAFSLKALGQLFSKQPKITYHIVIKRSWSQTRQLQESWV